jgi:hypothetical protein
MVERDEVHALLTFRDGLVALELKSLELNSSKGANCPSPEDRKNVCRKSVSRWYFASTNAAAKSPGKTPVLTPALKITRAKSLRSGRLKKCARLSIK